MKRGRKVLLVSALSGVFLLGATTASAQSGPPKPSASPASAQAGVASTPPGRTVDMSKLPVAALGAPATRARAIPNRTGVSPQQYAAMKARALKRNSRRSAAHRAPHLPPAPQAPHQ